MTVFPYVSAQINWEHPLAANLIFFAVPAPYGYVDLVRKQAMPHQPITASGAAKPSCIQLFTQTPLGMAAWSYGNGNTNPFGAFAVTPGLQPSYQPATAMTVAASCWSYPYSGGYNGSTNRLISATSGTDNTGVLTVGVIGSSAGCLVGGGGATTTTSPGQENPNNTHTTHCILGAYDGTHLLCQLDNGLNNNTTVSRAWAGINRIQIGDATANACGRPIFWAAAWNAYLPSAGSSSPLTNLVCCPGVRLVGSAGSLDGVYGRLPPGLLVQRRRAPPVWGRALVGI